MIADRFWKYLLYGLFIFRSYKAVSLFPTLGRRAWEKLAYRAQWSRFYLLL